MTRRVRVGVVASLAALAAAACDGCSTFLGNTFGTSGSTTIGTGTIQGTVTADGNGQGGISVVLVGQDSTVTNGTGTFTFSAVPAGTYQVAVLVPIGFSLAASQTSPREVIVTTGATTGVAFVLQSTTTVPSQPAGRGE